MYVFVRLCPCLCVSVRLCPFLRVSVHIFAFLSVSVRFDSFWSFLFVPIRLSSSLSIFVYFCSLFVRLCSAKVSLLTWRLAPRANKPPRPGIEPGSSAWQAEILTTILPRIWWARTQMMQMRHRFDNDDAWRPICSDFGHEKRFERHLWSDRAVKVGGVIHSSIFHQVLSLRATANNASNWSWLACT